MKFDSTTVATVIPKLKYQDMLDAMKLLEEQDKKMLVGITFNNVSWHIIQNLPDAKLPVPASIFYKNYNAWTSCNGVPIFYKKFQWESYRLFYDQIELDDYLKE